MRLAAWSYYHTLTAKPSRAELPMAHAEWYNGYGFIFLLFSFSMSLVYNLLVAMTQARITEVEAAGIIESSSAEGGSYRHNDRERGDNKRDTRCQLAVCLQHLLVNEHEEQWGLSSIIIHQAILLHSLLHCYLPPPAYCLPDWLPLVSLWSETLLLLALEHR